MQVKYFIRVNVESSIPGTPEYQEDVHLKFQSSIPFFPQKGVPVIIGREDLTVFRSYWDDKEQFAGVWLSDMREGVDCLLYKDRILEDLQEDGWVVLPEQDNAQFEE